ncbi:hypothetical protein Micbo1qcDRAFT_164225, partial [Microdochium bolleyi]
MLPRYLCMHGKFIRLSPALPRMRGVKSGKTRRTHGVSQCPLSSVLVMIITACGCGCAFQKPVLTWAGSLPWHTHTRPKWPLLC